MEREYKYDIMKGASIIGIMFTHCFILVNDNTLASSISTWLSFVFRTAIAIFLFLSGFFFKNKQTVYWLINRIKRLWIPYTLFTLMITIVISDFNVFSYKEIIFEIVKYLLCETVSMYYYVFLLIECTLAAFIIDKLLDLQKNHIIILIISTLTSILYFSYSNALFNMQKIGVQLSNILQYRALLFWFVFFLAGYSYRENRNIIDIYLFENKVLIRVITSICLLCANLLYAFSIGDNNILVSPTVFLMSASIILFILTINFKMNPLLQYVGQCSYTIYLCHVFFIVVAYKISQYYNFRFLIWNIPIIFIVLLFSSLLVCSASNKLLQKNSKILIGC